MQDIFSVVSDAEMEMLIDAMAKLTDSLGEKECEEQHETQCANGFDFD